MALLIQSYCRNMFGDMFNNPNAQTPINQQIPSNTQPPQNASNQQFQSNANAQSLFSQQPQGNNGSSFGGSSNNSNQQRNSNLFANNQAVNGNTSGQTGQSGAFSQSPSTFGNAQNPTSQSLFNQIASTPAGLFGSSHSNPPLHSGSLFNAPPVSLFGANPNIFALNPNDIQVFQMIPSESQLSRWKQQQLTNISNLKIWNQHGEIHFLEPVSIQDVSFQQILIMPNKIEVLSEELSKKKRRYLYHQYLNYTFLGEAKREVIRRVIELQLKQKSIKFISLSQVNGDLLVEL